MTCLWQGEKDPRLKQPLIILNLSTGSKGWTVFWNIQYVSYQQPIMSAVFSRLTDPKDPAPNFHSSPSAVRQTLIWLGTISRSDRNIGVLSVSLERCWFSCVKALCSFDPKRGSVSLRPLHTQDKTSWHVCMDRLYSLLCSWSLIRSSLHIILADCAWPFWDWLFNLHSTG